MTLDDKIFSLSLRKYTERLAQKTGRGLAKYIGDALSTRETLTRLNKGPQNLRYYVGCPDYDCHGSCDFCWALFLERFEGPIIGGVQHEEN